MRSALSVQDMLTVCHSFCALCFWIFLTHSKPSSREPTVGETADDLFGEPTDNEYLLKKHTTTSWSLHVRMHRENMCRYEKGKLCAKSKLQRFYPARLLAWRYCSFITPYRYLHISSYALASTAASQCFCSMEASRHPPQQRTLFRGARGC